MPKLRRFGATNIPLSEENTISPLSAISPDFGRSRPAIERSVVVLPQPLGRSSVNSLPCGTSNETSCAALTGAPRSPGYSVYSDLTVSTFLASPSMRGIRDAEPPAGELRQQDEREQRQ